MSNDQITKISEPIFFCSQSDDDIIYEIWHSCGATFPLVKRSFQSSPTGYLQSCARIVDAMDFKAVLTWITPERVATINTQLRSRLSQHIHRVISRRDHLEPIERKQLSLLPIYRELVPSNSEGALYR